MALVMIDIPDETLRAIEGLAEQGGTTPSGFLRALADREVNADRRRRASRIRTILNSAGSHDGMARHHVREARDTR